MRVARISRLQGGARSRRRSFDGTFPGVRCAGLHASGIDQVLHPTTKRTPLLQRLAQLVQAANSDTARTSGDTRYSDGRHRRLRLTTAEWRVAGGTRRALTPGREPTSAPAHHARCADSEGGEYPRCLTAGSVRASMLALAERPARRQSDQWCGPSHRHPESESHRRGGRGPPDPPPP